jgi:DNA-binding transcriptional MocR family regulator
VTQEANHARLNFSGVSDERIVAGMSRLAALLRERLPG